MPSLRVLLIGAAAVSSQVVVTSATNAYISAWSNDADSGDDSASSGCTQNGAPEFTQEVVVGTCTAIAANGQTFYGKVTNCDTLNAGWAASVYADSACTTAIAGFSGTSACDCDLQTIAGVNMEVNMRVTCAATQNNCLEYAAFGGSKCGGDPATYDVVSDGTCVAFTTSDDVTLSLKPQCDNGGSSDSEWTAKMYNGGSCSGASASFEGASGCACDAYAAAIGDVSIMVNCGGYEPSGCSAAASSAYASFAVAGALAGAALLAMAL